MNEYLIIFTSIAAINLILKIWLNLDNKNHILQHRREVPQEFRSKISLAEHQKAADYSFDKINFSNISIAFNFVILMYWIPFGGIGHLDSFVKSFGYSEMISGLIFFTLFSTISGVLSLPQSLYNTFVIEERYGFNKTTKKLFFLDLLKQTLLSLIIGLPFLYAILSIMTYLGNLWWVYAWVFIIVFQFVLIWAYPKFLSPLFNKFTPLDNQDLKERIDSLSNKININFKDYYVMNASIRSSHGNAYFTGIGKNKRIVFFDTLLETLETNEVEAVLAHELGHLKHKHIFKSLIISIIFTLIGFGILGFLYNESLFFSLHNVTKSNYMALMLFSMIGPVFTFLFTPIGSWFSRRNEYEADQFACNYSNGQALIEALVKMYKDNSSSLTPSPKYTKFYYSHPPAIERVKFIKSCL